MEYIAKEIRLRNGKTGVFRAPTVEDASALLEYLKVTAAETPFLLRTPEECTMTVEQEQDYLRTVIASQNRVMILCEVDGKLAGNCQLDRKDKQKTSHRAMVGIALLREFWGLGIGTAMLTELTRLARQMGLEQLELEVIEGNQRAMALYEKMGYRTVGAKPNAIRLPDGTRLQEFYMVKEL